MSVCAARGSGHIVNEVRVEEGKWIHAIVGVEIGLWWGQRSILGPEELLSGF